MNQFDLLKESFPDEFFVGAFDKVTNKPICLAKDYPDLYEKMKHIAGGSYFTLGFANRQTYEMAYGQLPLKSLDERTIQMYERFTDRARKVMQLANQEAQRFNHEYIGTEHVLLALIKEGNGVAANILKEHKLDLRTARLQIEQIVQSGSDFNTICSLPVTPRVKSVIDYAMTEARELGHNYIGTEHILLGLLCEKAGVAYTILSKSDLNSDNVRQKILNAGINTFIQPPNYSEPTTELEKNLMTMAAGIIASRFKFFSKEDRSDFITLLQGIDDCGDDKEEIEANLTAMVEILLQRKCKIAKMEFPTTESCSEKKTDKE